MTHTNPSFTCRVIAHPFAARGDDALTQSTLSLRSTAPSPSPPDLTTTSRFGSITGGRTSMDDITCSPQSTGTCASTLDCLSRCLGTHRRAAGLRAT